MTATNASSVALSVDDIMSDLAKLQQSQSSPSSSSSSSTTHPILSLGNSLLPATLQSERRIEGARPSTDDADSLEEALSHIDRSQGDALHLSSVYLDSTRRVLALNQDRDRQDFPDGQAGQTGGLFDDLHRRVAKLQSSNEGFKDRLQEMRQIIDPTTGQGEHSQ
jgi:hypothetical protein